MKFSSIDSKSTAYIGQVWEGGFTKGKWLTTRMLNGDETFHHEVLRVFGRDVKFSKSPSTGQLIPPQPTSDSPDVFNGDAISIPTPAIYRVKTYLR